MILNCIVLCEEGFSKCETNGLQESLLKPFSWLWLLYCVMNEVSGLATLFN